MFLINCQFDQLHVLKLWKQFPFEAFDFLFFLTFINELLVRYNWVNS